MNRALAGVIITTATLLVIQAAKPVCAHADAVAYLVNVTVRPGYNFADAAQALNYGYELCDRVGRGNSYGKLISDIQTDVGTSDWYQASYLLSQAVNELCPEQIWQLRQSAANYRPPGM